MVGFKARTLLAKTAGLNFVASVVLIIWHIVDGRDPDGTLIALALVLFGSGTTIAAIRGDGGPLLDKLLNRIVDRFVDALVASRPGADAETQGAALRLVETQETESPLPAPRRSVL